MQFEGFAHHFARLVKKTFPKEINLSLTRKSADDIGFQALIWLAGHEELLPVFLGASGLGADEIRSRAEEPELLASVLDFLLMDDAWITAFCDAQELAYDMPMKARAVLPGGQEVSWT